MDKRTEARGKQAVRLLDSELDFQINNTRALVEVSVLEALLAYVKALEEPPETVTKDVYLRGDWYYTILKLDLTEDQIALLKRIGERTRDVGENTVEVQDHNPEYPEPNWLGATRN